MSVTTFVCIIGAKLAIFCAGEEVPQLKISDPRCLSLHVIADPGQSESINTSFQYMIGRLNPSLDVLSVSERFKSHKGKENSVEIKDDLVSEKAVYFFITHFTGFYGPKLSVRTLIKTA